MARKAKWTDKDRGWRRILREIAKARGKPHVQVGIFGSKASAAHANSNKPNVQIAAYHEFGTETIPERSFIRGTVDEQNRKIVSMIKTQQTSVIDGRFTTAQALERVGLYVVGLMQQRISSGIPPPLKPSTVMRKKSSKPLIDTGQLRASIDHKVRNAL